MTECKDYNPKLHIGTLKFQTNADVNMRYSTIQNQFDFPLNQTGIMEQKDNFNEIINTRHNLSYFKTFDFIWRMIYMVRLIIFVYKLFFKSFCVIFRFFFSLF